MGAALGGGGGLAEASGLAPWGPGVLWATPTMQQGRAGGGGGPQGPAVPQIEIGAMGFAPASLLALCCCCWMVLAHVLLVCLASVPASQPVNRRTRPAHVLPSCVWSCRLLG